MNANKVARRFQAQRGKPVRLGKWPTRLKASTLESLGLRDLDGDGHKEEARAFLERNLEHLREAQEMLWAGDSWSVLVVIQAMDAAGKDGAIKHVMSGVNPQGCSVKSFKQPSEEEFDHTFLWRCMKAAPERGQIVLFNRSHYEDVLVTRVHPEWLVKSRLPEELRPGKRGESFWKDRMEDINGFERHLARNGTLILKFFLHVSREEQKERFLARIDDPHKNWKFSLGDVAERAYWPRYMECFEQAISATSTPWAPWYILPADDKWVTRALLSSILTDSIKRLNLQYPKVNAAQRRELAAARARLIKE